MTQIEWDEEWLRVYDACYSKKRNHFWAFSKAHEIMNKQYGSRPKIEKVHEPNLLDWLKLGLLLKRVSMGTFKNPGAWITALAAAFTTASAQYALANADLVVSGAEWGGIGLQFITVLLATVTKFNVKPEAPKE